MGPPPPQKMGPKNMLFSARFRTTSHFDREYLRNGTRYRQSEKALQTTISPASEDTKLIIRVIFSK